MAMRREFLGAKGETEATQAECVEAAEGTEEEVGRRVRRHGRAAHSDVDHREEPPRRLVLSKRTTADRAARRHVGKRERAGDDGHLGSTAHHDSHLPQADAIDEVALSQHPGNGGELPRGGRRLDAHHGIRAAGSTRRRRPLGTGRRGADARHDGGGECSQLRSLPVRRSEVEGAQPWQPEHARQPTERVGLSPTERVRRDIGVADGDDRDATGRERPQQHHGRFGCLLHVVDDDEPHLREAISHLPRAEGRCRQIGELGRVALSGPHPSAHLAVLVEEVRGGGPLGMPVPVAERAERVGVHAVLGRPHQQFT